MELKLLNLKIQNFKGIKERSVDFSDRTRIKGANASGKSTIFDAAMWLLFNKNSLGMEKFDVRPLDENGNTINYIDICVSGDFDRDGETFTLTKRQKQNWVKHRGDEKAEFKGNVNEYEINGYPKSEKEYKDFIASFIDEETFKLISNPNYFTSLPWKKQREILTRLVPSADDVELATELGGYDLLIPELKIAGTEDISKKWQKTSKELKAKQTELPVRIDELEKQKVEYDLAELELAKADLERKLMPPANNELKQRIRDLKESIDFEKQRKINELSLEVLNVTRSRNDLDNKVQNLKANIGAKTELLTAYQTELDDLGKKYWERTKEEYTPKTQNMAPKSNVCPTCGMLMPQDKIDALNRQNESEMAKAKSEWEEQKAADVKELIAKGNQYKAKIDDAKAEIKRLNEELTEAQAAFSLENSKCADKTAELNIEKEKPVEYPTEYYRMLEELEKAPTEKELTADERNDLSVQLESVKYKISKALNASAIDERISELQNELVDVAQKVADCEKVLYLLDSFIKAKMDRISEEINKCFSMINVRLFKPLINGGIEECCDITINGVPYASLNYGGKIVGGLDLIRSLSKIFDLKTFVFIDNSESINEFNIPEMACQIIELVVTDDKTLKVEV